jgi:hypothetical protein
MINIERIKLRSLKLQYLFEMIEIKYRSEIEILQWENITFVQKILLAPSEGILKHDENYDLYMLVIQTHKMLLND